MSSVKKNFIYQSMYQILTMILPLITAPYIARVLGSENVGIYSYTYTIANYFVVFAMLGLEQYGNRSIAMVRDNQEKMNKTFSEVFTIHFLVSVGMCIIYAFFVLFFAKSYRLVFLLQGIYVLSSVFDVNWLFFGTENFKLTVTRNIIIKVLSVLAIFILVREPDDLWIYTIIMTSSILLTQIILFAFLPKYVKFVWPKAKECIVHIKPLLLLFVALIAAHIYRMIDKVMLGNAGLMIDLGCYEYADKIIRIPLGIITALGTVMLSKMSHLFAKKERDRAEQMLDTSAMLVLFMSFAFAFGLAGIAPEFIIIFLGEEYAESAFLLKILSITLPLIGWNNFIRTQLLIPLEKDVVYTRAVCIGAIMNVGCNMFLIPLWGARGAAVATIFSYSAVLLVQMLPLFKLTRVSSYLRYIPFPLMFGGIMYIVVRIIGERMGVSVATVIVEILVGGGIYTVLSVLYLWKNKRHLFDSLFKIKMVGQ